MNLQQLKQRTLEFIKQYPSYEVEFLDYYYLAVAEVEEGGSENHECELAYGDMVHIVEDIKNNPALDLQKEEEYNFTQEQIQNEIDRKNEKI